jgi:hypothetical protein
VKIKLTELSKYTVADAAGPVDLARWIYAKYHGTGYTGEGTRGACVSDDPVTRGRMREAGTRLLGSDAPAHTPLSHLRVVMR